jgi:hypothetical protein
MKDFIAQFMEHRLLVCSSDLLQVVKEGKAIIRIYE